MKEGQILHNHGGFYFVQSDKGVFTCRLRGRLQKAYKRILSGDYVVFDITDLQHKQGVIVDCKARRSSLKRPAVANFTQIAIVLSAKDPEFDYFLCDKLLLTACNLGVPAILVVNKIDLDPAIKQNILEYFKGENLAIIFSSVYEEKGIETLRQHLKNHFTIFVGNSGVGKSSLINALSSNTQQTVGDISSKLKRGKNTTRQVVLIPLSDHTIVADAPGFSAWEMNVFKEPLLLAQCYRGYEVYADQCKFRTCLHLEEPDCAVKKQIALGNLSLERYENYKRLQLENKDLKRSSRYE